MDLNSNNNHKIIYRIAKNNLLTKKVSSVISMLSILLAVTLVSTLALLMTGTQTAEKQILDNMQHVMYMDITDEQLQSLASDSRTEMCVPYKHYDKEFQTDNVKYSFLYFESHADKIRTYVLSEGELPEEYNEIVVDKKFMEALGRECVTGEALKLDVNGVSQEFIISGYTDDGYSALTHPIKVSEKFAEQSALMKDLPYTALVRLKEASDMTISEFSTSVYQLAVDYGIARTSVNTNGKFEMSLQAGNSGTYTIFFVSVLLFIACGIAIYSIFYFSVTSRVQQIGQFLTIGMTNKQVKKMVRREGLILSLISIPAGLLLSGILSYLILPGGWTLKNFGWTALAVIVLGNLIVQLAIGKPASVASKIPAIEAANNAGTDTKEEPESRVHKCLTPVRLAQMEAGSNRKKWLLTTISLAFGGIIFMVSATWMASWDEDRYSRQELFEDGEYYITYQYDMHTSPKTYGTTDLQLTGHLGEFQKDLETLSHVKDVHIERSATGVIEHQGATFTQPFYPLTKEDTEYYELAAEGNNTYEYMAENDAIFIVNSAFSETINGITFKPGDKIKMRYFDGEEHTVELEIAAVYEDFGPEKYNRSNFCMTDVTMNKLWKNMNMISSFFVSADNYNENGIQLEEEIRALADSYGDLSLHTLREKKLEDAGDIQKLKMQIYGICIFIIVFSIFNLINTIISSITSRRKQLSMLESIGMEVRQVRSMLFAESILIALPNILVTLTIGTAAGFGFISLMKKAAPYLQYQFPMLAVSLYCAGMVVIPMLISSLCLRDQNKFSLVERIRNQD